MRTQSAESQYRMFVERTGSERTAAPAWEDAVGAPARELLEFADAHPPLNDFDGRILAYFENTTFYDFGLAWQFVQEMTKLAPLVGLQVNVCHNFTDPETPITYIRLLLVEPRPPRRTHGG